jgi:hypothetical protein
LGAKKVGHQISVSFEKFDVVQALLSFFCPVLLIKADFDWDFLLNKYSLQYLMSIISN